jgi:hypothetical protein
VCKGGFSHLEAKKTFLRRIDYAPIGHLEQTLEKDDDELASKVDIKIEIKLEPDLKQEYYEEIIDIKSEGNYGDDFDNIIKKEDNMVDDQVVIKMKEDLKTFQENKGTSEGKQNPTAPPCLSLPPLL